MAIEEAGISPSQFSLYDVVKGKPEKRAFAEFQTLTGGDQKISLVTYNVMDSLGNVTTRYMPGQTTFAPVVLLRPMDAFAKQIYEKIKAAKDGKLKTLRRDYSVSMNDSLGKPLVYWHLKNALPSVLDGFMFNMRTESSYTDFEVTFQAEYIEVEFL